MRKLILSFLSAALVLLFSGLQAQAGCQTVNLQNQLGSFQGTLCVNNGTNVTLEGVAMVAATGAIYTVDAQATISGSPGHYTVSGSVTISDGTNTRTIPFSLPCLTALSGTTSFVSNSINWSLSQKFLPPPIVAAPDVNAS